jgi:shikimate dehydrogenase
VIGWPIAHSLSPRLHGHWLAESGIDGFYIPLAVRPEDFGGVCRALAKSGFVGVNITVPHKEAAFALADNADVAAERAEAANLVLFKEDGRIEARNTDSGGLASSVEESLGRKTVHGAAALLLGAGGAARSVIFALESLGVDTIYVLNRNRGRADAMVRVLQPRVSAKLVVLSNGEWPEAGSRLRLLVNATSGGMRDSTPLHFSLEKLPSEIAVCDLVYNPVETELLKEARRRGHHAIDGLGMLIHQAIPAFEAFFGRRPVITEGLRQQLAEAIGG